MFIIKKLISQIFYPVPLLILLIVFGIILWRKHRKTGKMVFIFAALFFLFVSYDISGLLVARGLEKRYPVATKTRIGQAQFIVILGGGSCADPSLPATSQLHRATLARVVQGVIVLQNLPEATMITTGGALFDSLPIATISRRVAIELGVDSSRIRMADGALDTPSEALAIKEMVGDAPVALVTSALHMPRSVALFEKAGVTVIPVPTDFRVKRGCFSPQDLFPNAHRIALARDAIHERVGMVWGKLRGRI